MSIEGVSYAGKPFDNTVMYVTKKVEHLLENLESVKGCKIFVEIGSVVPLNVGANNEIVFTKTPQLDYARFVNQIAVEKAEINSKRKVSLTNEGYYKGENVHIGYNTIIEKGCYIGHDVVIGNNALIKTGACIKDSIIGDNFIACENCSVGTSGFTMADDENGNKVRIPTLGKVIIGDNVEINSLTNVSCGSAGNTIIEDNVKIDSLVYIGHDVHLCKNVEIPAGAIVGGFTEISEGAYVGINATLRNRIHIGKNAFIGMGAVVTKDVENGVTVVGNPARPIVKLKEH